MSLNSMHLAETLPDSEILEEFERLEEKHSVEVVEYARLLHSAYHRGCLRQNARCIALYMLQSNCSFEEATQIFADPLIYGQHLKETVTRYYHLLQKTKGGEET